jgi:Leucine-rich repeat (LRR) protein
MQNNHLKMIDPLAFANLDQLKDLNLSSNQLASFDSTLYGGVDGDTVGLTSLTKLHLEANQISHINLASLRKLKLLKLSENRLEKLEPNAFATLLELERLELQGNRLVSLHPHTFNSLRHLSELNLAHNEFDSMLDESLFRNLKELKYLNLINGKMRQIDVNIFRGLNKIQHDKIYKI